MGTGQMKIWIKKNELFCGFCATNFYACKCVLYLYPSNGESLCVENPSGILFSFSAQEPLGTQHGKSMLRSPPIYVEKTPSMHFFDKKNQPFTIRNYTVKFPFVPAIRMITIMYCDCNCDLQYNSL